MESHQVHIIEQLADRLGLGQGELYQIANAIAETELSTLYDLDRSQCDKLIVALDSLLAVGVR